MTNVATGLFPPESGPLARLTKAVAVLRLNPEELSERIGIHFQTAHDDLDMLDWARVIGLSGKPYALVRHRHAPEPGTQIVVPYDSNDLWVDVLDVLDGLNLSERDLAWTSPEAVSGGTERARLVQRVPKRKPARKLRRKPSRRVTKRLSKVQSRGVHKSRASASRRTSVKAARKK